LGIVVPERKAGNQWTVVIGFQEAALEDRPTYNPPEQSFDQQSGSR
jgi:hypothetical protein